MKSFLTLIVVAMLTANSAFASSTRTLVVDTLKSSDLSKSYSLPASSDTLAGSSVANYGTGAQTFASHGVLYGAGTSPIAATSAGSQFQVLVADSGGVPIFSSINLASSVAVGSSILAVANGGTGLATLTSGGVMIGAGASSPTFVTCSNTGYVLTWGGSSWSCAAVPTATPALNGGSGAAQSVTASGGVSLASIGYDNFVWVAGSGGPVIVTKAPNSVTPCTADGQELHIIGTDNTNTVKLQDQANLATSGLSMNGDIVLAKDSMIEFICDITQGLWVENSRR